MAYWWVSQNKTYEQEKAGGYLWAPLSDYHAHDFPGNIPDFNAFFMGPPGQRILNDIVYPGRWSVESLYERFGDKPQVFRNFCRFKWAFNIKPDMVVLVPTAKPISIEAKLESREGWYPMAARERGIFDELYGKGNGRVRQIELQQFMFDHHLGSPCQSVVIGRSPFHINVPVVFVTWNEVFGKLNTDSSLPYVRKLIGSNCHLGA
ncbi:MAG: hypothetical protein IIB28_04255 [Chloroflexi bacterium]|nr:hypothetical protein [Chloroflexota bacterium]